MALSLAAIPEHEEMVSHILAAYENATKEELAEGIAWYDEAQVLAANIAAGTDYTTSQIAAVIAVISPRLAWSKNTVYPAFIVDYHARGFRAVEEWRAGDKGMSVTHQRRRAAVAILDGDDPFKHLGIKTGNFFLNIMGDPDAVTVDSWATKVALGNPYVEENPGDAAYRKISDAYQDAAKRAGLSARAMQAATWVHYRNAYGDGKAR